MQTQLLLLTLGAVTLCLTQNVAAKYKVNPEALKGDVEVLSRFVSLLSPDQQAKNPAVTCSKIARELTKANEAQSLNIVDAVRDSLLTEDEMRKNPVYPVYDMLEKYLLDALDHMLESKDGLDKAFIPLVDCVQTMFGDRSLAVKRYLAKDEIRTNYEQMKQLLAMKLEFFVDPNYQHPTLRLDELTNPIRRALINWFHGSEAEMSKHFYSDDSSSVKKLRHNLKAIDEKVNNVEEKMSKWNLNQQCKIYSAISQFGLGQISGSKLDSQVITATMNNASDRKIEPPTWVPSEQDAKAMVSLAKALAFQPGHQSLYAAVLNCAMKQLDKFDGVQVYLKSSEVHEMYEQLQKLAYGDLEDEEDDGQEEAEDESDNEAEEEDGEEQAEAEAEEGAEAEDEDEEGEEEEEAEDGDEDGEEEELDDKALSRIEQGTKGKVAKTLKNIPALIKEAKSQHPGEDGDDSEDESDDEDEEDDEEDVEMSPEHEEDDEEDQPVEEVKPAEAEAEAKDEVEAEAKNEAEVEAKAEAKDEGGPETKAETKTETEAEGEDEDEDENEEVEIEPEPEHQQNPAPAHVQTQAIHEINPINTQHPIAAN